MAGDSEWFCRDRAHRGLGNVGVELGAGDFAFLPFGLARGDEILSLNSSKVESEGNPNDSRIFDFAFSRRKFL